MTDRGGILTGVVGTLLVVGTAGTGWWLLGTKRGGEKPSPPPIPATVAKPFQEDKATAITLTADAETRLAITTGRVERKPVPRRRVYGGEVTVPPGRSVVVSAPLAGTLRPVAGGPLAAGRVVRKGCPVLQLLPLLDPVGRANLAASRADAEGQVTNAAEQLKLATITHERAKTVFAGGAGRQRDVDEAQVQLDVAKKLLAAVTARRDLLSKAIGDAESGTAAPIPVEAPEDGILRAVTALPGQTVPAGAWLFEVINLDRVWVRVPVYVGDLADIDPAAPAEVGPLAARPGDSACRADPEPAPPAANPAAGTADRFYAMNNCPWVPGAAVAGLPLFAGAGPDTQYSAGERVGVTVALKAPADGLTVPWAAVVYDYHGGTWVYEKTGDRAYTRRRVVVRYVVDGAAVLDAGPPAGTPVVIAGAAELFGTETGFSK